MSGTVNAVFAANANAAVVSMNHYGLMELYHSNGTPIWVSELQYAQLVAMGAISYTWGNDGENGPVKIYSHTLTPTAGAALDQAVTLNSTNPASFGGSTWLAECAAAGWTPTNVAMFQYSTLTGGIANANATTLGAANINGKGVFQCSIAIGELMAGVAIGVLGLAADDPTEAIAGAIIAFGALAALSLGLVCTPDQMAGGTVPGVSPIGEAGDGTTIGAGNVAVA